MMAKSANSAERPWMLKLAPARIEIAAAQKSASWRGNLTPPGQGARMAGIVYRGPVGTGLLN